MSVKQLKRPRAPRRQLTLADITKRKDAAFKRVRLRDNTVILVRRG